MCINAIRRDSEVRIDKTHDWEFLLPLALPPDLPPVILMDFVRKWTRDLELVDGGSEVMLLSVSRGTAVRFYVVDG